jgi:hypothetical protein
VGIINPKNYTVNIDFKLNYFLIINPFELVSSEYRRAYRYNAEMIKKACILIKNGITTKQNFDPLSTIFKFEI